MILRLRRLPTLKSLLAAPGRPYIHRDLSWLQFNDRVLAEARNPSNPLFERAKFLSISSSNLDEFFTIRFASLASSIEKLNRQGNGAEVRLRIRTKLQILDRVRILHQKQTRIFKDLKEQLTSCNIHFLKRSERTKEERKSEKDPIAFRESRQIFFESIFPFLDPPQEFDIRELQNLANLQFAFLLADGRWIKIPKSLPPAFFKQTLNGNQQVRIHFLDDLLLLHASKAFDTKGAPGLIRVTRDGDISVDLEEDDPESLPDVIRSGMKLRDRGKAVRLQYEGEISRELLYSIVRELRLSSSESFPAPRTLCLHGLWSVMNRLSEIYVNQPRFCFPSLKPYIPLPLRCDRPSFETLRKKDILLHHPYDSFEAFISWIRGACLDPQVESIEMTIYRTDALSPIVQWLKKAAKTKKIRVFVELRARFDELNNLKLSEDLTQAGVAVVFGFGALKIHAKLALITRLENGRRIFYSHLSTGNYNAQTARQYTDLSILTANQEIGEDIRYFFRSVQKEEIPKSFKQLISAPIQLHRRILSQISMETLAAMEGKEARIFAKVNALVDQNIIESLYAASKAGVQIDLVVRGACSLIPGVKGLSENIRVISIVDRFLEHSRIYFFGSTRFLFLSSADWMPRNFFSRLEVAFPVLDPALCNHIKDVIIPTYLKDSVKSRRLTPKGLWMLPEAASNSPAIRSQGFFEEMAKNQYRGTSLEFFE